VCRLTARALEAINRPQNRGLDQDHLARPNAMKLGR
jgi:hypothetical protein